MTSVLRTRLPVVATALLLGGLLPGCAALTADSPEPVADASAPAGVVVERQCAGNCNLEFVLNGVTYRPSCTRVRDGLALPPNLGAGRVQDEDVHVRAVRGVDRRTSVAVSRSRGICGEAGFTRSWVFVYTLPPVPQARLSAALCRAADLSQEQRKVHRCQRR